MISFVYYLESRVAVTSCNWNAFLFLHYDIKCFPELCTIASEWNMVDLNVPTRFSKLLERRFRNVIIASNFTEPQNKKLGYIYKSYCHSWFCALLYLT